MPDDDRGLDHLETVKLEPEDGITFVILTVPSSAIGPDTNREVRQALSVRPGMAAFLRD